MKLKVINNIILAALFASILTFNVQSSAQDAQTESNTTKNVTVNIRFNEDVVGPEKISDFWNMVASMSQNSGSSRLDYQSYDLKKEQSFDWDINLDRFGRYHLSWRVDYGKNLITFGLELDHSEQSNFLPGSGIFGLGFSQYGELSSSDYCIIWYDLSHKIHLQDARTDSDNILKLVDESESVCRLIKNGFRRKPDKIEEDDYKTNEDEQIKDTGAVEIVFKRQLEVCPLEFGRNYYKIDNGTTHLVWFSLMGPVLSIDGLNISDLIESSSRNSNKNSKHQIESSERVEKAHRRENFEFGLNRVQLIATKSKIDPKTIIRYTSLDIRMEKYQVPARETTYWCKLFKLPKKFESRRYHITSYEASIEPGNEHIVHHMELFNCANLTPEQANELDQLYSEQNGWSGNCSGRDRPKATDPCRRVILAWAMGARPLIYPEQVGQSIGGPGYSPYVVLEVHYNNVGQTSGLIDSSGLRFRYSSKLRPYDAGVLEVGLEYTDKNSIPPKMLVPLAGYCVSECTRVAMSNLQDSRDSLTDGGRNNCNEINCHQNTIGDLQLNSAHNHHHHQHDRKSANSKRLNNDETNGSHSTRRHYTPEGIYIFAAQMHTHLTGVASWTEHFRDGRWLGELQRDNHYSPHFQEIRLLPEPVHLLPGDSLIHYCLYDTRKRENITLGGFATADEMCVTYLHYYPKIDLEVCKSSVDSRALEEYFAYLAEEESQSTSKYLRELHLESANNNNSDEHDQLLTINANVSSSFTSINSHWVPLKSVSENYRSIEWSPRRSRELMEFYANAPLSVQCNRSNGQRWPGSWIGLAPIRLENTMAAGEVSPDHLEITSGLSWPDNRASRAQPPYVAPKWSNGLQLVGHRGRGAGLADASGPRHAHCRRQRQRHGARALASQRVPSSS